MTTDTAAYCKKYIERVLADLKEKRAWNSWRPVMQRALDRHDEMAGVYREILKKPEFEADGLLDYDRQYVGNSALKLTLETFWLSKKQYEKKAVTEKRDRQKELVLLQDRIQEQALMLAQDMRRYGNILEHGVYDHDSYTSVTDLIDSASDGNGHYDLYLKEELTSLSNQYDGKYWPSPTEIVQAIAEHYASAPLPESKELPQMVMDGRQAPIKDYVLAVDRDLQNNRQIPSFRLSDASMATVVNVVLDLPVEAMVTGETIRQVRNRHQGNNRG